MSHKMLRPFIVKVSVLANNLGYFPTTSVFICFNIYYPTLVISS